MTVRDLDAHRTDRVNLGEGGLWVTKPSSRDIKKVVSLVPEPGQVSALVASLMRGIYGKCLMLLHI